MNIEECKVSSKTDNFKLAKSVSSILAEKTDVRAELIAMGCRTVYKTVKALSLVA